MKFFFEGILEQSINGGWVILIVLLLRTLLKRAPKWSQELLWGLVAIRLLLPFSIESKFSLVPQKEAIETIAIPTLGKPIEFLQNGGDYVRETVPPSPINHEPTSWSIFTPDAIGWIWLAGIAAILIFSVVRLLQLRRKLKEALLLQENIYLCDHVDSPFILGILRPKIYFPSTLSPEEYEPVLAHERAHLKRKDHWIKPLAFLLATCFWFHPLVWVAYFFFCRDLELACDEKAIKDYDLAARKTYTETLLRFGTGRSRALYQPLAFGESNIKGRIKNIVSYKKPTLWIIIGALILCIIAGVCLLTDPKSNADFDLDDIGTMNIGAEMPRLIYGDDTKVILTGTFGLLQYDVENQEILHRVPMERLKKISLLHAYSNRTGTTVYIVDYVGEPVYQYDTNNYELVRFKGTYEPAFEAQAIQKDFQFSATGLYSETYIERGNYNYYLIADADWRMATLKLVKQSGDICEVFPIFPAETDLQDAAIRKAIIQHCKSNEAHRNYCAESHKIYHIDREWDQQKRTTKLTAYLLLNYSEERLVNGMYTSQWGQLSPAALTFTVDENAHYTLIEFWEPRDGDLYEASIREKFPFEFQEEALSMDGRAELARINKHTLKKARKLDRKGIET